MKRAAIYVRVSSQGQVRDGYSLQFQEEILKEFCQREGLVISGIYRDGGQSGSTTQRKDLQRLIEDARQSRFDMVLIFRVDRFSRDPLDLLALVKELETKHIRLRSVTEAVDAGDPSGELMLTILGAIGKFVRQNIIQNAMLGKTKRAEGGKFTGGKLPFGYVADEAGVYRPDQQLWWNGQTAAEIVKLVYSTYIRMATLEGAGCKRVAQRLNEMGVTPPLQVWAHATVHQILSNPCYAGDFAYNKRSHQLNKRSVKHAKDEWLVVRDAHEPIVDRETWDRVQAILKGQRSGGGRPANDAFKDLATGFLRCGECGSALTPRQVSKNQKYRYYACVSRYSEKRRREGTYCADFPWLRGDELEALIWEALVLTATEPGRVEEIRERMSSNLGPELGDVRSELTRLEKHLNTLEQQAMTITTAYAEGKLPDYLWQKQLERVEKDRQGVIDRIHQTQARLHELEAQAPVQASNEEIQGYLREVLLNRTTLEERREALAILVGQRGIRVMKDGTIDFDIKIPPYLAAAAATAESSALTRPGRSQRTR